MRYIAEFAVQFSFGVSHGIHKLIMLIMPNTIENKSKNRIQINKMAIEEKT